MIAHRMVGGAGAGLNVVETGNRQGQSILFIHGLSQCSLAWGRQLSSNLGRSYRLVAMDLRGHGASDRPRTGYDNSQLWANDVDAVISGLRLERPILCGWSYGPLVILDYLRHYGEESIGGIHMVAAVTKLGSPAALAALTPEFLALVPQFFSREVEESVRGLESLLRMCFVQEPGAEALYTMLGYSVSVPPFVREALLSRALDNDDVLSTIRKPVLITHGANDAVVKPEVVDQHRAKVEHAQIHIMDGAGHAPFWDDAGLFNRQLAEFCERITGRTDSALITAGARR